ncbi:MAG: GNAT family N-acetyltransferase [Novosphingobium sp. 28-62-57]|uniref:GNAT family N-acetyltransferase n=1 Tax=unclassified Novosphingobium TaxID=2644732 RepID=UPI000BD64FA2|nr:MULTISPECIES: GNAT family N-acetyltransferase [unclassified Novosphingobium]OYW48803.1 MAG: GNAT family N-acetyltransferase [Novosphingobium sp. 12-62-10]OYZ12039.1 MAG: GNAT family N-acetyltransferase [Novosphingobium sp. 28-62-57]HQS69431.1 GNAT family N-acetyltransferase [Novosphingobium sp.]
MTAPTPAPTLAELASKKHYTTRDGLVLEVRPAFAEDEALLEDFFDKVSPEDRRFRFLGASKHVGHSQLVPLTHVDHWRTESFLAFDQADGALAASAMLACDAAMDTAEIAVSIRSDLRGRGVGWAMLDLLADAARDRGLKRVISIEDRDNHAAIELEREKGFVAHGMDGDPHLVMLEKTF